MIKSSYNTNNINYGDIFSLLVRLYKPKKIVEFGILEGYSLKNMADAGNLLNIKPEIVGYDIFNKFNGNHANMLKLLDIFSEYKNIKLCDGDFYKIYNDFTDNSIDMLHIDIANDGNTFEFAITNYLPKMRAGGIMILEGGSVERDNIEWMIKYNKKSINSVLNENNRENIIVMNNFPSLTIILKDN